MPRGVVVVSVLALAIVTASGPAAMSKSSMPAGFNVVASASLYSGVDYAELAKPNTPVLAHVARVAPGAPVDLRVVNANDKISRSPSQLEPTSSICGRLSCIVGVNGDFHRAGVPAGAVIVDGRMLHSPDPARPQLTVTGDGRLVAGPLPWTGSLTTADGTQLPVTAVNDAPAGDGLALYTPAYGTRTDASGQVELVVRAPAGIGSLNRPTDLELRGLRSGAGPIPPDGAVLSGTGAAGQQLRDLWTRIQAGKQARGQLLVSSPIDARFSLGAEPVVLRDGRRALPWRDPNVINPRQPHTLVGWNKAGETYLVAVDGRQAASEGMTMAEAADFLLALGVTDAVSLDGGGGTTFVVGGSVWNRPSDDDPVNPAKYAERGTANALVVMPRPGAPLPPASPAAPKPAPRPPAGPGGPGGSGTGGSGDGTTGALPWDDSPATGVDGGPVGPRTGADGGLAEGELPVGPAHGSRVVTGSGAVRLTEPGLTTPGEQPGGSDPAPSGEPTGASGTGRATGPEAGSSPLPRQVMEAATVAVSHGLRSAGRRAAAASGALLLLLALAVKRRHRRRLALSLLIEGRQGDPLAGVPAPQGNTTRSSRWITSCGAPSGSSLVRDPASSASSTEL